VNSAPITPVSGYGEAATAGMSGTTKFLLGLGVTGLALGAVYAFTRPKAQTPNRRRR